MIGVCDNCKLKTCDESRKGCRYTELIQIERRRPQVIAVWNQNLERAREVRTARRLLGFKKYNRRFKYAKRVNSVLEKQQVEV